MRESGHPGLRYFLLHIVCRETSGRGAFQRIFSTVYIYFFYFLLRIVCREKNCRGALPRNFSFSILLFPYYFYFLVHIVCLETIGRAIFQRIFFFFYFFSTTSTFYSNVGRLFCTPAPPKFTKKLAVDSFFNFGS